MSIGTEDRQHRTADENAETETLVNTLFGALCAFGLGGWIFHSLWQLESGAIESTQMWGPVAMLYETLGFWPAVGALPALGSYLVYRAAAMVIANRNS